MPVAGMAAVLAVVTLWAVKLQSDVGYLQRQTRDLTTLLAPRDPGASVQSVNSLGVQLTTVRRDQNTLIAVQADPNVRRVEFEETGASHGAAGLYLWSDQTNAGVLSVHGRTTLPLGQQYKVWLEDRTSRSLLDLTFLPDETGNS